MTQQTLDGTQVWVRPPPPPGMCMQLTREFMESVPVKAYIELGCFGEPNDKKICAKLGYCERTKYWVEWVPK